jgi:glycosyltransferase involved in cell wall biosynthesis
VKAVLASFDHFHILNQARELEKAGCLARYYATRLRVSHEGLPAQLSASCYPLHYALRLKQMGYVPDSGNRAYLMMCRAFDAWVRMSWKEPCDILTILSGVGLWSFREARRRGVCTVVDCGSTHTDYQHRILSEEFARNGLRSPLFPAAYRGRVRAEFTEADFIQIPSGFVKKTFLDAGISEAKILQAPYGADLSLFHAKTEQNEERPFRVICPSGVNLRKGARIMAQAWKKLGWKDAEFLWIGRPGPESEHLFAGSIPGIVWQSQRPHAALAELYRSCDVFMLPSFEEGLARVMIEAASCGLPLIATPNTGVEDFFTPGNPEGWLIPANDVDALCDALIEAKSNRRRTFELGQRGAARARQGFSWEDYGRRVIANYRSILGA